MTANNQITVEKIIDDNGWAVILQTGQRTEIRVEVYPPDDEAPEGPFILLPRSIYAANAVHMATVLIFAANVARSNFRGVTAS